MIKIDYQILPKEEFYVAVSGGNDSIAASHVLLLKKKKFSIIHINHKFIPEDDAIADSVKSYAKNLGVECKILESPYPPDFENHLGSEGWCRKIRMDLFSSLDKNIIMCHHLDDAIESYLMNAFRGNPHYCPIPFETRLNDKCKIIRPFLFTRRQDFEDYVELNPTLKQHIFYDPMNNDLTRMRNWTRHLIIPTIGKQYQGLPKVVRKKLLAFKKESN